MSNTTISPNMGMPVPVVSTDPGPDWANNVNACLGIIDQHTHSPGQGVPVSPDGMNINADLPMGANNLTGTRTVRFTPQSAPLSTSGTPDINCVYESGVDLYYNDGNGNQVRITQSGAVTGATGTITGLPSGTASASFAGSTFTFQSATSTPAQMAVGPIILGRNVASSNTITIQPNSAIGANYTLTLPAAVPSASNAVVLSDTSGTVSFQIPVYLQANGASNTASTTVPFKNSSVVDTTGSYSASTGQFTCPATGYYSIIGSSYAHTAYDLTIYIGGVLTIQGSEATSSSSSIVSAILPLTSGTTIDIRPDVTVTATGVANINYLHIYKVG